jgi:hypothetical protein
MATPAASAATAAIVFVASGAPSAADRRAEPAATFVTGTAVWAGVKLTGTAIGVLSSMAADQTRSGLGL